MFRKTIYLFLLFLFLASCQTMSSVKRGLGGEKINNTDEFLVEKKDPLILPPDFENLPIPGNESEEEVEEGAAEKEGGGKRGGRERRGSSDASAAAESPR